MFKNIDLRVFSRKVLMIFINRPSNTFVNYVYVEIFLRSFGGSIVFARTRVIG